ncbi:MAG: DEAD/DEAH box helicase family protein, partial [Caldilineaceae bacterium]|nr:DEAD/DEAH box helicase family protein [Caldilineaceae bacterium]
MHEQPNDRPEYWQAEGFVELCLSRFRAAQEAGHWERQRTGFYQLTTYHGRTLGVLNSGLHRGDEALVQAALHNLLTLHRSMMHMHRMAPRLIPLPLALSEHSRGEFVRDLIMRVLTETPPALTLAQIHQRANDADLLGQISDVHLDEQLQALIKSGHVDTGDDGCIRTTRPYVELDKDVAGLRALIGRTFYAGFAALGYDSLGAILEQRASFKRDFHLLTRLREPYTIELFLNTVQLLLDTSVSSTKVWRYADLLHSPHPRPYQQAAFDVFRQHGYDSIVIDAPTGSGKTLIGMMCIQDWLRTLDLGQSILILVPTNNYQQQWIDELCYNASGLQLPPELIFAGTPAELDRFQRTTGGHPALLLVTYSALAQLGSPTGKGGFDAQSVEMFLQQANTQHVILDEVHKVLEDLHSVSADLARLLVHWQRDTSFHSLIGFSGTAAAFQRHCADLGLTLAYRIAIEDLVAAGFVAPFA